MGHSLGGESIFCTLQDFSHISIESTTQSTKSIELCQSILLIVAHIFGFACKMVKEKSKNKKLIFELIGNYQYYFSVRSRVQNVFSVQFLTFRFFFVFFLHSFGHSWSIVQRRWYSVICTYEYAMVSRRWRGSRHC